MKHGPPAPGRGKRPVSRRQKKPITGILLKAIPNIPSKGINVLKR
jgi:hypothetical protein